MEDNKTAEKITVEYNDGSVVELKKGLVFRLDEHPENGQVEITADMVGMSGADLYTVVHAAVNPGGRLGMFRDREVEEEE